MEYFVFFVILMFAVLSVQQNIGPTAKNTKSFRNKEFIGDDNYNLEDDKNNDFTIILKTNKGPIIRPCPSLHINCIRQYFREHGKCQPSDGTVPEPLYRAQANFFYSFFNLSVAQTGILYRGLNDARIEEFYINTDTDLAVLAIQFLNFRSNSTQDFYRYHRVGKEPAITKSQNSAFFPSFTTTTIFRGVDQLDLAKSETTGFIDASPQVVLDPSAGVNPDPIVAKTFALFMANVRIVLQEALLTDPTYFASTYIQYVICDFGLKLL